MTSYERTIIFEANHNNSVDTGHVQNSNDFTVHIPPLDIPRGSTISLDGGIIQQQGANSSMIELNDENFSDVYPYQSSFMGMEYITYINHTGMNMCVFPCVAINQFKIDPKTNDGKTKLQGENINAIPYRQKLYVPYYYLNGEFDDFVEYYFDSWDDLGRTCILYENTPTDESDTDLSLRFFKKDLQVSENIDPTDPPPSNPSSYPSDGYSHSKFFAVSSPVNMCNALHKSAPDGSKYVYMNNYFHDPCSDDNSKDFCEPNRRSFNIDLTNKLLETPDEITFKINSEWTRSRTKALDNEVPVVAGSYNIDQPQNQNIQGVPFYSEVFNISGQTLFNIPANLQTTPYTDDEGDLEFGHKVYSNMFVKDYKRWMGGTRFLNCLQRNPDDCAIDGDTITIENFDNGSDMYTEFWGDYLDEGRTSLTFFPAIYGFIYKPYVDTPIYKFGDPYNDNEQFFKVQNGNENFLIYSGIDVFGDPLDRTDGFNYFLNIKDYSVPPHVFDTYFLGRIVFENSKQKIVFYAIPDVNTKPYAIGNNILLSIDLGDNILRHVEGGDNAGIPKFYMRDFRTERGGKMLLEGFKAFDLEMTPNSIHNGLPFLEVGNENNFENQYCRTQETGKMINNDFTAIPRYFLIPTNLAQDTGSLNGDENSTLVRIKDFFRSCEVYVGNKNTYREQQLDYKNWCIEVDLGFHNDGAIGEANVDNEIASPATTTSYTFWDKWFTPVHHNAGTSANPLDKYGHRQSNIFSMGRFSEMGTTYTTNEQKLRLFSRFQPDIIERLRVENTGIDYSTNAYNQNIFALSPNITIQDKNEKIFNLCKELNICVIPINYFADSAGANPFEHAFGFVNFQDTWGGDGGKVNSDNTTFYDSSLISDVNIDTTSHDQSTNINAFDGNTSTTTVISGDFNLDGDYVGDSSDGGTSITIGLNKSVPIGGIEIYHGNHNHGKIKHFRLYGSPDNGSTYYHIFNNNNVKSENFTLLQASQFLTENDTRTLRTETDEIITKFNKVKIVIHKIQDSDGNLTLSSVKLIGEHSPSRGLDWRLSKPDGENFRTTYRILAGVNFGFDPSATANPFGIPMSTAQSVVGNKTVGRFRGFQSLDESNKNPSFSSYIEEYINNIYIGAISPSIDFGDGDRFELKQFHTPFKMNMYLEGGDDSGAGDTVSYFNLGAGDSSNAVYFDTVWGGYFQSDGSASRFDNLQHINKNIVDSISGIGIYKLFVRGQDSDAEIITDIGALECKILSDGSTQNYDNSLLQILGFKLEQLLPFYGRPHLRFDNTTYNSVKSFRRDETNQDIYNLRRYEGCSFFTTNSFFNQSSVQNISLFSPNYPDQVDHKDTAETPDYSLSYVGFSPLAVSSQSDRLRAENLPQHIQDPYYIVYSDIPSNGYLLKGNQMNIIGYIFKQYKNQSYYFNYAQNFSFTMTTDMNISKIRTAIYSGRTGKLAKNLGQNIIFFYRASIPSILSELPPEPSPEEIMSKQRTKLLQSIVDGQKMNFISNKSMSTKQLKTSTATKMILSQDIDNPDYADAVSSVSNLVSNYLITQLTANNRQILSDYRANRGKTVINRLTNTLVSKRKEFTEAHNSIMSEILSTDKKVQSKAIKELREATRGRGLLKSVGIFGSQIIGFPKSEQRRGAFGINLSPDLTEQITMTLNSSEPAVKGQIKELLSTGYGEDFTISTDPRRKYDFKGVVSLDDIREFEEQQEAEEEMTSSSPKSAKTAGSVKSFKTASTEEFVPKRVKKIQASKAKPAESASAGKREEMLQKVKVAEQKEDAGEVYSIPTEP